jgi:alpha-tubulin suppressor-like RCC1 family protein
MKTKSLSSFSGLASARAALAFAMPALGAGFWACTPEFKATNCPEGTEQNGGGSVEEACRPVAGSGGAAGGTAGAGGAGGGAPVGGNAGSPSIPPGGECAPTQTRCVEGAQQTCGGDGKWGAAATCDLECDQAGVACVVPLQLAADENHACARLSDGTVRCWGSDLSESLGNGEGGNQTKPRPVAGIEGAIELDPTGHCARFEDRAVKCWGSNAFSRFDPSSGAPAIATPSPLVGASGAAAVAVGIRHSCILDGSGTALCKGNNSYGVCGGPDTSVHQEYGAATTTVQFKQIATVVEFVENGLADSNLALTENGSVYCWGWGSSCGGAPTDGTVLGTDDFRTYTPRPVPAVSAIKALGQGSVPCAVGADGRAQCWGRNDLGQLGRGTSGTALVGAGPVSNLDAVVQIASGSGHACAVKEDGSLYCWGANNSGQLGATCGPTLPCQTNASTNTSFVPNASKVDLEGVLEVRPAGAFTCARTASRVYCWGDNAKGQLGDGTTGVGRAEPEPVVWK